MDIAVVIFAEFGDVLAQLTVSKSGNLYDKPSILSNPGYVQ
jgi:hypothetical protein